VVVVKRARLIAFTGVLLAAASLTVRVEAGTSPKRSDAARCDGIGALKTFSDPLRKTVQVTPPRVTTIQALGELPRPQRTPTRRTTSFQRRTWEVVASVDKYRIDHGELRLVLFDNGSYINAVVPLPACLPTKARERKAMIAVWNRFAGRCGRPTNDPQPLGAVAYVRGVGYWNPSRSVSGMASNGAELHPLTSFRPIAGC
jgi:hypothetical protein